MVGLILNISSVPTRLFGKAPMTIEVKNQIPNEDV